MSLADLDGRIDLILDAGPTRLGARIDDRRLPRRRAAPAAPGAIAREAIEAALGRRARRARAARRATRRSRRACSPPITRRAPRLRLEAREAARSEAALDFGGALARQRTPARGSICRRPAISPRRRPISSRYLRALDAFGLRASSRSRRFRQRGLGVAINDRLRRAAAPRDGILGRASAPQAACKFASDRAFSATTLRLQRHPERQ